MLRTIKGDISRRLRERDDKLVDDLVAKAFAGIERVWPQCYKLTDQDRASVRATLHRLYHMAEEALSIAEGARLAPCVEEAIGNQGHNILLRVWSMMTDEMVPYGGCFLKTYLLLPQLIMFLPSSPHRSPDASCVLWTSHGSDWAPSMIRMCEDFVEALDWLASNKRPPRYRLWECLHFLLASALQMGAVAAFLPVLVESHSADETGLLQNGKGAER